MKFQWRPASLFSNISLVLYRQADRFKAFLTAHEILILKYNDCSFNILVLQVVAVLVLQLLNRKQRMMISNTNSTYWMLLCGGQMTI